METSDQILQSDILGMFEARHSRSIKNRDGFLKAGVEALNAAPIDGIKSSDLAKISSNSIGNFYTRLQGKIVFLFGFHFFRILIKYLFYNANNLQNMFQKSMAEEEEGK